MIKKKKKKRILDTTYSVIWENLDRKDLKRQTPIKWLGSNAQSTRQYRPNPDVHSPHLYQMNINIAFSFHMVSLDDRQRLSRQAAIMCSRSLH